jgi:hypothetical protein
MVYIDYNEDTEKWEVYGCGFYWVFDTEKEVIDNFEDAWKLHTKNLAKERE